MSAHFAIEEDDQNVWPLDSKMFTYIQCWRKVNMYLRQKSEQNTSTVMSYWYILSPTIKTEAIRKKHFYWHLSEICIYECYLQYDKKKQFWYKP